MTGSILTTFALLGCLTVQADDAYHPLNVKPGEWDSTFTVTIKGAPPIQPELLEKLPPEQRAKMEERMKANGAPRTISQKTCVKKEDLNKPFSMFDSNKGCTRTFVTSSATRQDIRLECNTDKMKSTGTVRIEAMNSENIKGSMQMTMTIPGNRTMNSDSTFTARWIGATCTAKE